MIVDGREHFRLTLEEWATSERPPRPRKPPGLRFIAAMAGLPDPPPLTDVSEADPLPARVYRGQWIVDCPCRGAGFVWVAEPITWCGSCGNRALGGSWRRVELPEDRAAIEVVLLERPDPDTRNWEPGETVAELIGENAANGIEVAR